ncbi:MAG: signal peptidase II [Victivallaceae bacterium]
MKKDFWANTTKQPNGRLIKKFIMLFAILLTAFLLDFGSKIIIHNKLIQMPGFELTLLNLPKAFPLKAGFSIAYNTGAAFGWFSGCSLLLLIVRIFLISVMISYVFLRRSKNLFKLIPAILITGGAIGNVTDFFLYGHVIDFIKLGFSKFYFPVFNLADFFITVGFLWFVWGNAYHSEIAEGP